MNLLLRIFWVGMCVLIIGRMEPLHTLVDKNDPRRESLQQALSEFVRENGLWRNCTQPCPPGSQRSASDFCSCECPKNDFTDSTCCAPKRGVAKLTVTIKHAEKLWGHHISRSDSYVSVSFKNRKMCTHIVWNNNNNPTWNATLDFGVIELNKDSNRLQVEVWDEDSGWNDDLLGRCYWVLEYEGIYKSVGCYFRKAELHYQYRLDCGHKLIGPSCWDYSDQWPYLHTVHDSYHYEGNVYKFSY